MIGAIIGDTVGSVYEFNNIRSKNFKMFAKNSFLTDDSIMTLAVAEIIQNRWYHDKDKIIDTLKKWGRSYPDRGYGGMFYNWLFTEKRNSYGSYGNGAAMRISAVGWYGRDEAEIKEMSKAITEVTHSHPEGIKGAEVVAMCIYFARKGKTKEFIRKYVEQYYDLNFDYDYLMSNYSFNETCQETVPQAIYCFLISSSFEDCLRTTISIGGDCDTTAAISCAIAEAYYKDIDEEILCNIYKYLPKAKNGCNPLEVVNKFMEYKTSESIMCEEITNETKMICSINEYSKKTVVDWFYSKSVKALVEYMVFEELDKCFGVEDDDLSKDLLKERNIEGYVDCIGLCSNYKGNTFESLLSIKDIIKNVLNNSLEIKELIDKINNQLTTNKYKNKYLFFNNPNEAMKFMKENLGISSKIYSDIFNRSYEIIKDKL